MICDDESVYCNILKNHIDQAVKIRSKIDMVFVSEGKSAIIKAKEVNPDLVIMDVDLGKGINGFEAVRQIRYNGSKAKICIQSNRGAMEYQQEAVDSGANLFMLKPMGRYHLLNIILNSLET